MVRDGGRLHLLAHQSAAVQRPVEQTEEPKMRLPETVGDGR